MQLEEEWKEEGSIAGLDEAGRGALAGPLAVACVRLKEDIPKLDDSKRLTAKEREDLEPEILNKSENFLLFAQPQQIDEKGIDETTIGLMERMPIQADVYIVDGERFKPDLDGKVISEDKADRRSSNVAAASILAKVGRDRLMEEMDYRYPYYDFAQNKGYGTKAHRRALEEHGLCEIHRVSFIHD